MVNDQIRQGDVLLARVEELPADLTSVPAREGRFVLALGEATGHAHAVAERGVRLSHDYLGSVFLEVGEETELVHEEHAAVRLGPGVYRVIRQREYRPGGARWLGD